MDLRKYGDDMFPTGTDLLLKLETFWTLTRRFIYLRGLFLLFLSLSKPIERERPALNSRVIGPRPRFRGMSLSVADGFGSSRPYGVDTTPTLFGLVANAGRSL